MLLQRVKDKLNQRWSQLTLRQQLVVSLWACTIPISAAGSALILQQAYQHTKAELRQTMAYSLANLAQVMKDYLNDQQAWLGQFATGPTLWQLDTTTSQELVDRARRAFPSIELSVFRLDGSLVASNAEVAPIATGPEAKRRQQSRWFLDALQNRNQFYISEPGPSSSQQPCLIQARAIVHAGKPVGVLQSCVPPERVGSRSGIGDLVDSNDSSSQRMSWLDFDQGQTQGRGILLVSNQGQLLLLHKKGKDVSGGGRLTDPVRLRKSAWASLVQAIQNLPTSRTGTTEAEFSNYLLATSALSPNFTLTAVIDKDSLLQQLREVAYGILAINFLALVISSIAIARISKPLLHPIDAAGEALKRISDGDFDVTLPSGNNNDIGRLFTYITTSAERLKTYVAEATKHAVNTAQISEAKRLQAGFLVQDLPETEELEIAALCQPAYDIGADWYDAIPLGEARAVVVADVCDKGIPSALYMSVFRSLLRLSLEKEWLNSQSCAHSIGVAVSTVNRYMAETHGHTGMFATAFVAVYEPSNQTLTYVLAGHETPLLKRAGEAGLHKLELSGPALGLFSQAQFSIHSCPLRRGDLLLAFSDGLPDGRNGSGESFGHARIEQLLDHLQPNQCSAHELMERVRAALEQHCQGTEPFDDLTLLVLKHVEPS